MPALVTPANKIGSMPRKVQSRQAFKQGGEPVKLPEILIILQQLWIKPARPIESLIRFSVIPAVPPPANRLRLLPKVLPDLGAKFCTLQDNIGPRKLPPVATYSSNSLLLQRRFARKTHCFYNITRYMAVSDPPALYLQFG